MSCEQEWIIEQAIDGELVYFPTKKKKKKECDEKCN